MGRPQRNEDADIDEGIVDYQIDQDPMLLLPKQGTKAVIALRNALKVPSVIDLDPELREMAANARFMEEEREAQEREWSDYNDRRFGLDWDDDDLAWGDSGSESDSDDSDFGLDDYPDYDYDYDI
jgi:hypothetical protein